MNTKNSQKNKSMYISKEAKRHTQTSQVADEIAHRIKTVSASSLTVSLEVRATAVEEQTWGAAAPLSDWQQHPDEAGD